MSTRGVVGFIKDGEHKVSYNHSDSYPSWLGTRMLEYINDSTIEQLNKDCDAITLVDDNVPPTNEQKELCKDVMDLNVGEQSEDDWYCLLRAAQGDLKEYARIGLMIDGQDCLREDSWCEWMYLINLDTNKLEIYCGTKLVEEYYLKSCPKEFTEDVEQRLYMLGNNNE